VRSVTRPASYPDGVVPARCGDHPAIQQMLLAVMHGPSALEFQAAQDEPGYQPCDRLLVKAGDRVLAHVQLRRRTLQFGSATLPCVELQHLATLPECRRKGLARRLLAAAEQRAQAEGAVLLTAVAKAPEFFARHGWARYGRPSYTEAGAREILAQLQSPRDAGRPLLGPRPRPLNIRLWRHFELRSLMRIYEQNTQGRFGPLVRSEVYWWWLMARKGYDSIYVAIDGPDSLGLEGVNSPIIGYAATKAGRIVELLTAPQHPEAAIQLLARASADAIERDEHRVRYEAPPDDPLHALLQAAGGRACDAELDSGPTCVARWLQPELLVARLCAEFARRARDAGLSAPCELGLHLAEGKFQLSLDPAAAQLAAGRLGRCHLLAPSLNLVSLLLGHADLSRAEAEGKLAGSSRAALDLARALFPPLPLWRPPLDDLPA